MTITRRDPPLFAVLGVTSVQGVMTESDKAYRVRGFTRDASKPALRARRGVVVVSLVMDNKDAVYKAFAGADYFCLVKNCWEHADVDRARPGPGFVLHRAPVVSAISETQETSGGKFLIDTAKAGGVWGFVRRFARDQLVHIDAHRVPLRPYDIRPIQYLDPPVLDSASSISLLFYLLYILYPVPLPIRSPFAPDLSYVVLTPGLRRCRGLASFSLGTRL
ncbi:hypothetical protein B0H11DRAFT_2345342 [Mycena galericulata]|nr:hypothetical protein B0H11DRAFT_2345342 [Mycena galericulata]